MRVPPLSHMAGLELVEGIAGRDVAQAWGEALVAQAEGLPIQLCSAAAAVAYEMHRRRTPALPPLADAASQSFGFVYSLLPEDCHVLLRGAAFLNGQRLSRGVLAAQLRDALDWHDADFFRSLDAVMDFHVLEFSEGEQLRMHRLFGAFVRAQVLTSNETGLVERLHLVQRTRAVEAAKAFVEQPRRTDFATALLVFPLGPPEWDAGGAPLDIEGGEALGEALCVMGHFEEARARHRFPELW